MKIVRANLLALFSFVLICLLVLWLELPYGEITVNSYFLFNQDNPPMLQSLALNVVSVMLFVFANTYSIRAEPRQYRVVVVIVTTTIGYLLSKFIAPFVVMILALTLGLEDWTF